MEEEGYKNEGKIAEDITVNETQSETKVNIHEYIKDVGLGGEEAGPSNVVLPGAITKVLNKTAISKSEVNIRQIITNNETATIALTSLSFANQRQQKEDQDFIDLKKFMASCLKNNPEKFVKEIINIPVVIADNMQSAPLDLPMLESATESTQNNTVVTDSKLNKVPSDSKKKAGNISQRSGTALAQSDSLSSIGSNVCRICMTRGRERLISPCNCKGSLANVHLSCLERWLNQVGRNHCELCGFSYPAIRTPRYTILQALRLWFGNPRNRSHLQSDCLIFWLLSTVTAGLLSVCVVGTQYFVIEGKRLGKHDGGGMRKEDTGISHRITETAMNFFMAIVLCGYFVTVYLLWKDHYVMWNRWRRANVNVRLLLTPDSNPVPFVPRPEYTSHI